MQVFLEEILYKCFTIAELALLFPGWFPLYPVVNYVFLKKGKILHVMQMTVFSIDTIDINTTRDNTLVLYGELIPSRRIYRRLKKLMMHSAGPTDTRVAMIHYL